MWLRSFWDQFKAPATTSTVFTSSTLQKMAQAMAEKSLGRRKSEEIEEFSDNTASFADIFFGFVEGQATSQKIPRDSGDCYRDDADEEDHPSIEDTKTFWETQNQLLQGTLYRTSSFETKIRKATKEAVNEVNGIGIYCVCRKQAVGVCRDCLQAEISVRLQAEGYNCAICRSKWKSFQGVPSGEHTYLEVVDKFSKKGDVRVVIELNFRAEFEMARASEDYNQLINRLPEVFVGKAERLNALIKILCSAAKTCMKEKKMHLAPWRKQKYMQSKWLGTCERMTPAPLPVKFSDRPAKPRASMLTYDLLETMPVLHRTAVKVL